MSAKGEAVERLAKAAKGLADDWGWKGGKKGEITGGVFSELFAEIFPSGRLPSDARLSDATRRVLQESKSDLTTEWGLVNKANQQLEKLNLILPAYTSRAGVIPAVMQDFAAMERAGIPREWTGKIAKASGGNLSNMVRNRFGYGANPRPDLVAIALSDAMRPMTNDQREAFLNLLPRWIGTLETAAAAAKKLYRR